MPTPEELQQDPHFIAATPADQIKYLSATDPAFKSAHPDDQAAYLAHVTKQPTGAEPYEKTVKSAGEALDTANQSYEGKGVLPALGRLGTAIPNMARQAYHAVADEPKDAEERATEDTGSMLPGGVGGRSLLAAKRMLYDPGRDMRKDIAQKKQANDEALRAKGIDPNDETNPTALNAKQAQYVGNAVSAVPMVGPMVGALGERAAKGDVAGALTESAGYALAEPVAEEAMPGGALPGAAPKGARPFPAADAAVRAAGTAYEGARQAAPTVGATVGGVAGGIKGGPEGAAFGTLAGERAGRVAKRVLPSGEKLQDFGRTPEDKLASHWERETVKADKEVAKAQEGLAKFQASTEGAPPLDPDDNPAYKKAVDAHNKAVTAANEAHFHLDNARQKATAAVAPPVPDQEITPEAVAAARPVPETGTTVPKTSTAVTAARPARSADNVKTPGQVQPETFPQEPTAKPEVPRMNQQLETPGGAVRMARTPQLNAAPEPKLLTEGTPEPTAPVETPKMSRYGKPTEGGPKAIRLPGELKPGTKAIKLPGEAPEEVKPGRLSTLKVDEQGKVVDTEPQLQQKLEEALNKGSAEAKPVVTKPEELNKPETVSEQKKVNEEYTPEHETKVEQVLSQHSDQDLIRFAKKAGIDADKYDFAERDANRHRVQRDQLVKDLLGKLPEGDKANIARLSDEFNNKDTTLWSEAERSSLSKAQRSRAIMQEHEGGPKTVSGGSQATDKSEINDRGQTLGFDFRPAEDIGNKVRAGEKGVPRTTERRAVERNAESDAMTKPFSQARKELGEDATFEQLEARAKEIKAGSTSTKEGAAKDNDYFAQAKKELPNAKVSEQPKRADELKRTHTPTPELREIAKDITGKELDHTKFPKDERGADIANAYDKLKHDPKDPKVKAAYDALIKETKDQWQALKDKGYTMSTAKENPYDNAEDMLHDIKNNKHITVWEGGQPPADHPLSAMDKDTGVNNNTLFRAVHDILGHGKEGNDFSEAGEENAYRQHSQMYSKEAQPALATETKGQASWVFNHEGVRDGSSMPGDKFPEQKAALMPEEFHAPDAETNKVEAKKVLDHIKADKPFSVLTAENPKNTRISDAENAKLNEQLVKDLRDKGYEPVPVEGNNKDVEGKKEHSFFVPDIKPEDAVALGKKYQQSAILTQEGLHDLETNKVNPSDNAKVLTGDKARNEAYFSVAHGEPFSVPLDFDKSEPSKLVNEKGSPIDEFGNPTVSGGSPAAGSAKAKLAEEKLPDLAEEHLTPEERAGVTKSEAGRDSFVKKLTAMPDVREFTDAAIKGEGGSKWYQRGAKALDALAEEAPEYFDKPGDREKFAGVLAASSPQQSVVMNMREALRAWTKYVDAGRPEGPKLEKLLRSEFTLPDAKVPNAMKAIQGEPLWPDITKNAYFKVPSFAANLNGMLDKVTNDGWMALFSGIKGTDLKGASSYHPISVMTRAAAKELGWEPAEAQAAIWAFIKTLTEKGEEDPHAIRNYSEDFADILQHDPETRSLLGEMGIKHGQLDARLAAIEGKPEISGRTSSTAEDSSRRARERVETARGKGTIPPPKSGDLFAKLGETTPDEGTEFNPNEFNEPESKVKLTPLSERGGKSILSIKVDGERAGQISMTRLPNLGKNAVEVSTSQLKPEFRGKGHGTPAYEQAIQYARDKGYSDIYSDDSVSMKAENVWKSLEKKGEAKWDGKLKRYKISAK